MQGNAQVTKHGGFLEEYRKRTKGEVERAIVSLRRLSSLHIGKTVEPERFSRDWGTRSVQRQRQLIRYWFKEAITYAEQAALLRELVNSFGCVDDDDDYTRELHAGHPAPDY